MYVSCKITNTGIAQDDVWVSVDSFSGGVISLATNEDGKVHFGAMANGEIKTAFFYLQASGATASAQTHTVHIHPTRPPTSAGDLASANFSMTAEETIKANANKVNSVVASPNPPALGGAFTITVTGATGTIGAAGILSFTPASFLDWRADSFELLSTSITFSGGNTGTFNDQLLITTLPNSTNTDYTALYTFRAVNTTSSNTPVSPVGYIIPFWLPDASILW